MPFLAMGIGGAAALETLLLNEAACKQGCNATVVAGADLDGSLSAVIGSSNSLIDVAPVPHLLVGGAQENDSADRDKSWQEFEKQQTGWKREGLVKGAAYLDFSDVTFWKELVPGGGKTPDVGSIKGKTMVELLRKTVVGFFDFCFWPEERVGAARIGDRWRGYSQ